MEEAERLCDRIAVIDAGKVVAIDTPAGLVTGINDEQRIRFRPSAPIEDHVFIELPEVRLVEQLIVTGSGNVLHAVTSVLARQQIIAGELRGRAGHSRRRVRGTHRQETRLALAKGMNVHDRTRQDGHG